MWSVVRHYSEQVTNFLLREPGNTLHKAGGREWSVCGNVVVDFGLAPLWLSLLLLAVWDMLSCSPAWPSALQLRLSLTSQPPFLTLPRPGFTGMWTDFFQCSLDVHIKKGYQIFLVILIFPLEHFIHAYNVLIKSIPPFLPSNSSLPTSLPLSLPPPHWVHLGLPVCMGVGPSTVWVASQWPNLWWKVTPLPLPVTNSCQSFSAMGGTSWAPAHPCWVLAGLMLCRYCAHS